MRILFANYSEITSPGGVHKTIRELAKHLSDRGHDVTVIQANPMNLPRNEVRDGYKIVRLHLREADYFYGFDFKIYNYLKECLAAHATDIIHVHGFHTLFSPCIILSARFIAPSIPIIFSPHLDISRSTFLGKHLWNIYCYWMRIIISNYVDYIVSPSLFENKILSLMLNSNTSKMFIIPHGVDVINPKNKFKINSKINLIYIGQLIKRKNVEAILYSLNYLIFSLNERNVSLKIYGDGPEREKLLRLSSFLKLEDYIIWRPPAERETLTDEIIKAEILLLLSHSEAYGIIIGEALALGTPCIVTNTAALSEFMNEPGCYGVEYPPEPHNVAELIVKIHESDIKIGPLSNRIMTWNDVTDKYEKLYLTILNCLQG